MTEFGFTFAFIISGSKAERNSAAKYGSPQTFLVTILTEKHWGVVHDLIGLVPFATKKEFL